MLVAEIALQLAIRARIRAELRYHDEECDLELDNELPDIASKVYVAIVGAGVTPGERHNSSGTVWDLRYSVRVTIFERITEIARDRRRNVFSDLLLSVNTRLDDIIKLIDNNQTLRTDAQDLLVGTSADGGEFPEPFRTFVPDATPRAVYREPYDAAQMSGGDPIVALARGVVFQRARFMWEK